MIELFDAFRDSLYNVLKFFQQVSEPLLGSQSYWFAIVLLTVAVRTVLIPLTVKQVKSTRVMQELQPEIKKLQAKHKNDKQKLTEETMKLYQERGFNPLSGCWPLLAQMPFFFALYRVFYSKHLAGESNILLDKKFFVVPLSDTWSGLEWADRFTSAAGLIILALIVAMSLTTYISQKQLLSRQGSAAPPQQQMLIKILPFTFLIFAINVPLAIVIYWVTTNLWSMGQQWVLLRSAPPPPAAAAAATQPATTNGGERKPAGALAFFRGLVQSPGGDSEASQNGGGGGKVSANRPAAKGSSKAARPASEGKAATESGGDEPGKANTAETAKGRPQAKPGTRPGQSQSGGTGSRRSSRKGKSGGGPRRGKR